MYGIIIIMRVCFVCQSGVIRIFSLLQQTPSLGSDKVSKLSWAPLVLGLRFSAQWRVIITCILGGGGMGMKQQILISLSGFPVNCKFSTNPPAKHGTVQDGKTIVCHVSSCKFHAPVHSGRPHDSKILSTCVCKQIVTHETVQSSPFDLQQRLIWTHTWSVLNTLGAWFSIGRKLKLESGPDLGLYDAACPNVLLVQPI